MLIDDGLFPVFLADAIGWCRGFQLRGCYWEHHGEIDGFRVCQRCADAEIRAWFTLPGKLPTPSSTSTHTTHRLPPSPLKRLCVDSGRHTD